MSIQSTMLDAVVRLGRFLAPDRVKAWVYGLLYNLSGKAIYGFRHALVSERAGRLKVAKRTYRNLLEGNPEDQRICFQAGRHLWRMGESLVDDPLFACVVSDIHHGPDVLELGIDFIYPGLWMLMSLEDVDRDTRSGRDDVLEIRLDDVLLRRHRLRWVNGKASFQFIVKRDVVSAFPRRAILSAGFEERGSVRRREGLVRALVEVPHGDGSLDGKVRARGILEKKGDLPPGSGELRDRQDAYLAIYQKAAHAFEEELGCRLFVLYGTLLGLQRAGDFIPGDDDFDVGYVSKAANPEDVKAEASRFIRTLVARGFKVALNSYGRPFRLTEPTAPDGVHLDVRPVWSRGDGYVWMHKSAHLKMDIDGFRNVMPAVLRGARVWMPAGAEEFLRLYYGENWRVPDPGFSNSGKAEEEDVRRVLEECCFSVDEQARLLDEIEGMPEGGRAPAGSWRFVPVSLVPAYPLVPGPVDLDDHRR